MRHRQSQIVCCHGSTASSPPGSSEEEAQADGHLGGHHISRHQVSRLGPLHFGEEDGNDSKSLPHGAGPEERVQGGKPAQVGQPWSLGKQAGALGHLQGTEGDSWLRETRRVQAE